MDPLVYIILLNWNGWRDTIDCLNSIKKSDYQNYQIIVVDNGSTDDSVLQLRLFDPNLIILESGNNLGFAGGNNIGIRYALQNNADYIWLLNNDTIVDSSALSAMVKVALSDTRIGAVGSVLYYMDDPYKVQAWGGGWVNMWLGIARHYLSPVAVEKIDYITGASLFLNCKALNDVGFLDDNYFMYWEDTDFGFRLRKSGWKLSVAAEAKVFHKESASLGNINPIKDKYLNSSAVRFFNKHAPIPIIPIVIGSGGRLLKRLVRGDWKRAKAICKGITEVLGKPIKL